jgi:tetratricopeptide (TPR) repeat protein
MYAYALNSRALELNKEGHYSDAVEYEKKAINLSPDKDVYRKNMHNFSENLKAQQAGTLP